MFDKKNALFQRKLRLRKEAGVLDKRERELYARELEEIEEADRAAAERELLESVTAVSPESSEPARKAPDSPPVVDYPVEWVEEGPPDGLSFFELL